MDRRTFLANAALTAAACQLAPAQASDRKEKIGCALLGLGHGHDADVLKVLKQHPDYSLLGVAEPDPSVRKRYADHPEFADVAWIEMSDLLSLEDLQVVAVESDVPRLLELGNRVVEAGKHLHLDKPAGTSYPDFVRLMETAERKEVLVQMGYMFRYNPGFDLIRKACAEGALGEIHSIQASMCTDLSEEKRSRIAHHPGGILLELGCHLIDMIHLILGEPKKVTSFLRHDTAIEDELNDNSVAVLEYENALAVVECNAFEKSAFSTRRFKVVGNKASLVLSPLEPPRIRTAFPEKTGEFEAGVRERDLPDLDRHVADFTDLAQCVRGEKEFAYPKPHDLAVQRTVLKAAGVD
jgi:predicted dehydrogenase